MKVVKAIVKLFLIMGVLFVAALFAIFFAYDAHVRLTGRDQATVVIRNKTDELIVSAKATAFGVDYPAGEIRAHEEGQIKFRIDGEGEYVVSVELASGKKLIGVGVYITFGMPSSEAFNVYPDRITYDLADGGESEPMQQPPSKSDNAAP